METQDDSLAVDSLQFQPKTRPLAVVRCLPLVARFMKGSTRTRPCGHVTRQVLVHSRNSYCACSAPQEGEGAGILRLARLKPT